MVKISSMVISNGIIFIWTGTNALIPSGWSRVTDMDDKYPKGTAAATNPNTTGGATTHTHTSSAHTHTSADAHTHAITVAAGSGSGSNATGGQAGNVVTHTHTGMTSGALASFSSSSAAATYGATSNDPENYTVIYVTPTTSVSGLPAGIIGLTDSAVKEGFKVCDGNNGTPNLVDKFLKGATTGANAGTTGGSKQNTHALSHTHTTSHTHASVTSGISSGTGSCSGSSSYVNSGHTHAVTLPASTPSTTDNVSLVTTETNIEPAFTKLMAIKADALTVIPPSIIALWLNTLATIPSGWILCDGNGGTVDMRGRHLKITATLGEVGTTDGSNTHVHAEQTHSHTVAHTHSASVTHNGTANPQGSSGTTIALNSVSHAISTDSVNLVTNTSLTTADSSNNEPEHRTVAFIKLNKKTYHSAAIFSMI